MTEKKSLLIVDDEKDLTYILQKFFSYKGYDTDVAYTGEEAIEKIENKRFDLIILDIMLPGMDGYEVCKRIKIDRRFNLIPVLMLTVKDTEEDKLRGFRTGADGYIAKPFDIDELDKYVKEIIEKNKILREEMGVIQKIEFSLESQFEYLEKVNNLMMQIFHYTDLEPDEIWNARLALSEIGANAIEHGNKGDREKAVKITFMIFKDRFVFEIEDEGEGFDYSKVKNPLNEVLAERGRGLFLAQQSMDAVDFLSGGKKIRLTKYIKKKA